MERSHICLSLAVSLLAASLASADPLRSSDARPPTSPATEPAAITETGPIVPTATPAVEVIDAATPMSSAGKLLILPFTSVDPTDVRDWIGRGLLSSLQGDLSRLGTVQLVTVDPTKPENVAPLAGYDTQTATKLARAAGAQYVIYGTYHVIEPELRLVGIILDTRTAQPVGSMKATGTVRDIFGMEDSIGMQAKRQLPQGLLVGETPQNVPAVIANPAPALPATPINPNDNGPVRNPYPAVVFDDDAASRTIDRLRYRDDWDAPFYPYTGSYFGFGSIFGYGFGWGRSHVHPIGLPSTPRSETHITTISTAYAGTPFRGGTYLESPLSNIGGASPGFNARASVYAWPSAVNGSYSRTHPQTANYVQAAPLSSNYAHPTPQTGNFVQPIPQTGNNVHPTPQSGNYIRTAR